MLTLSEGATKEEKVLKWNYKNIQNFDVHISYNDYCLSNTTFNRSKNLVIERVV